MHALKPKNLYLDIPNERRLPSELLGGRDLQLHVDRRRRDLLVFRERFLPLQHPTPRRRQSLFHVELPGRVLPRDFGRHRFELHVFILAGQGADVGGANDAEDERQAVFTVLKLTLK